MSDLTTQVLFVPYSGGQGTKKSTGEISQQKHAAREYHRKAKLKRQAQRSRHRSADTAGSNSDSAESRSLASKDHASFTLASRSVSPSRLNSVSPGPRNTSPVSLLGAGRIDPFDSQPVKDLTPCVHQMIDYALVYQWPIFRFVNPQMTIQDMKSQIAHRLRISQTSFYCTIFAAATHYALSRVGQEAPSANLMLRLDYKDRCLKMMLGDIKSLGRDMPDEMLHAIFALASYGSAERILPMGRRDLKNPLATGFDLDVYSRIPAEYAHIRALSHLLRERGGLGTIKRRGFAAVISLYDVFTSFRVLQPPEFPLLHSTSEFVDKFEKEDSLMSRMCQPLQILLPHLPHSPQFNELKSILQNVIVVTLAYEKYEGFETSAPALHSILMARHCVLHDLLSIGDAASPGHTTPTFQWASGDQTLYDLTWLAVLSYMVLDLFPCTRGPGPHEALTERLGNVILRAQEYDLHFRHPVLCQWATELRDRLMLPNV